ncbi:MAG: pyridoxal phosphate-dependent aminotransferase [Vampirovibrionales bacterium]
MKLFKLEDYLSKYEFTAKYLLCCSDAESLSLAELLSLATPEEQTMWETLSLGYTEPKGLSLLRHTVAKTLYPELDEDNILMFSGAEEGIFCAFHSLLKSNDHAIVLTPCYQSLSEIPQATRASVTNIELSEKDAWKLDLDKIRAAIQSNTTVVVINFPHNPTGQVIEEDELQALVQLCDSHGIYLFSDEVYRLLGQPQKPWASPVASVYAKGLSLGVMSKAFGLPGLRIG